MLVRLLNLVLPGTGLILRRREWLGFSVAMVFGISANIALAGWLIAPLAIPPVMTALAGLLSITSWLAAQILLHRHVAEARLQAAQLQALLDGARASLDHGDFESARLELEGAAAIDEECAELSLLRTRLRELTVDGPPPRDEQPRDRDLQHDGSARPPQAAPAALRTPTSTSAKSPR